MVTKEFHSFAELEQFCKKGKRKRNKKKEEKPITKYTKTNDTEFARFASFEKLAKNTKVKVLPKEMRKVANEKEEEAS